MNLYQKGLILLITTMVAAKQATHLCNTTQYSNIFFGDRSKKSNLLFIQEIKMENQLESHICMMTENNKKAKTMSWSYESTSGLDYDSHTETIYESLSNKIGKRNINGGKWKTIFLLDLVFEFRYGKIQDIAIDWVAQNLYVLQEAALGVIKLVEERNIKYIYRAPVPYNSRKENNYFTDAQLIVRPNQGYVYIATDKIIRLNSNGYDLINVTNAGGKPFAVDSENRIFYTKKNGSVELMDLNTNERKSLDIHSIDTKSDILVDDLYIYYVPENKDFGNLVLRSQIFDSKPDDYFAIYSFDAHIKKLVNLNQDQEVNHNNPCKNSSQICENDLCFAIPYRNSLESECVPLFD